MNPRYLLALNISLSSRLPGHPFVVTPPLLLSSTLLPKQHLACPFFSLLGALRGSFHEDGIRVVDCDIHGSFDRVLVSPHRSQWSPYRSWCGMGWFVR